MYSHFRYEVLGSFGLFFISFSLNGRNKIDGSVILQKWKKPKLAVLQCSPSRLSTSAVRLLTEFCKLFIDYFLF